MDTILTSPATISLIDEKGSVAKTWRLEGQKTFKIGRSKSNDIALDQTWISRQHAMLQVEENGTFNAIDLGSSNGTFVNGRQIYTPTPLHSGDLVQIGTKTTLTFLQDYKLPTLGQQNANDNEDEKTVAFLEKEQITILICDIRDFTSLSEKIGDKEISDFLKIWGQKTNEIVNNCNGTVDKFIGDAVMAIWAGSKSMKQNINYALSCTARIAKLTEELGRTIKDAPWTLKIGAALNTGEAVVGNIGVDGHRDYTVIGDVVNVAFKLEEATNKVGKDILIGGETANLLNPQLLDNFFEQCSYVVKGKRDPVIAHGCSFSQLQGYLSSI